jgi:chitin disaccharide deacetylase
VRCLIVNADDFGLTPGVNRAIVQAHSRGIVTSSTMMANGTAFEDAVRMAQTVPDLGIGCHVVLIDGKPVTNGKDLPSITSQQSGVTHFRDGLKSFAVRALAGRLDSEEIEAEVTAQIRKLQLAGITVSHVDTHKHTHLYPVVLRPLLRAAKDCGVRAVRNPFGPRKPLRSSELLRRPSLWARHAELKVLSTLANKFRSAAQREDMLTTDGTLGIAATGTLDEQLFRAIADIIPEGTWEFVCHPGYNDDALRAVNTRLRESRAIELRLLTMPEVRELLASKGIQLISYRELAGPTAQ